MKRLAGALCLVFLSILNLSGPEGLTEVAVAQD